MALPLQDILVADFTRVLAGPYATATLADLGARVIKVERPRDGDDTRQWGPPWSSNSAAYFESVNRSKESVTIDLKSDRGRRVAWALVRRADVVIENFLPGTMDRFGLGYEDVRAVNDRAIYCSISGFGSGGGRSLAGYDFLVQALGGLMSITGEPEEVGGQPMKVGVALVDVLTAKDATVGILAALRERDASGKGQLVEVNLLSSLLASLVNQASSYLTTGVVPERLGNAHPSIAPYESLPSADGALVVACGNDSQFTRLAEVLGAPYLATDERFRTNEARVRNREDLVEELSARLLQRKAEHWASRLRGVGVPAGRVGDLADAFALAEEIGLEPVVDVGDGRPPQVRHPISYSRTPVTRYVAPPLLGADTESVRRWLEEEEHHYDH